MDQSSDRETLKRRAIIALDEARAELGAGMFRAKTEYNPKAIVRHSMEQHRWWWLLAAAVGGVVAVRWFTNPAPVEQNSRDKILKTDRKPIWSGLIFSGLWALARRPVLDYAKGLLHSYVANKLSNYSLQSPQPPPPERYQ